MKDIMAIFNEYAKKFDLTIDPIMGKFHHSYRVYEYGKDIAKSLNLSEHDIYIVSIACLFHDVSRFLQWTLYNTYEDAKSFDHGDKSYEILKDELIDKMNLSDEDKNIVLKACKIHNKYQIEGELTAKELVACKIVRDADKIDIMKEQGVITKEGKVNIEIVDTLMQHKMVPNRMCNGSEIDATLRLLAFTFDVNYKYSYQLILDNKIIENKINMIEIYSHEDLSELQNNMINYIKERIQC